jgi:hypothetical protein
MSEEDTELWNRLVEMANRLSDGHLTVMKIATHWRVGFFTPNKPEDIDLMVAGETFADAASRALEISAEEQWPVSRPRGPK